jgi:hypothetical protein
VSAANRARRDGRVERAYMTVSPGSRLPCSGRPVTAPSQRKVCHSA